VKRREFITLLGSAAVDTFRQAGVYVGSILKGAKSDETAR